MSTVVQHTPIENPEVAAVFAQYPKPIQTKLMDLRQLILDTAEHADEVDGLIETLKWDQPSYLTERPGTGTTIRIDQESSSPDKLAM